MQTKLQINLSQGIIDVEGDVKFVQQVYSDFRERLMSIQIDTVDEQDSDVNLEVSKKTPPKRNKRAHSRKPPKSDDDGGIDPDNPKLDKDLNLSKLPTYFGQFEPKNNAEKILIFAKFLIDELKLVNPNTDQFYTCFVELKEKIPSAFAQAFRDAHGRSYGYIDYKSATKITVPIKGTNYFNDGIKRNSAE